DPFLGRWSSPLPEDPQPICWVWVGHQLERIKATKFIFCVARSSTAGQLRIEIPRMARLTPKLHDNSCAARHMGTRSGGLIQRHSASHNVEFEPAVLSKFDRGTQGLADKRRHHDSALLNIHHDSATGWLRSYRRDGV